MRRLLILFLAITIASSFYSEAKAQKTSQMDMEFHQELSKREITLHQLWDELLQKHVSENGNVNYKSLKKDHKKLLDYIYLLGLAHSKNFFQEFSKEEKLAFWINAYNALTVDLIIRNYPIKSIKDIKNPWKQRLWKPVNFDFSLDEIEHEILRNMDEPRIHFAIVCASYSCPKLQNKAFTDNNLDEQLTNATKEFLADETRNKISEKSIKISKIFDWFKKDFTQDGSLIDFLNKYTDVTISPKAKKRYLEYNWALNE